MSQGVLRSISRRRVLQGAAAGGLTAAVFRPAFAVPETVKIGLVGPRTGPLALFYEEMGWTIDAVRKSTGNAVTINGTKHPLEIVVKDSQSNPNRASEVAQELILSDKVHIVTAFATPETVNPVSDQCEVNGMPCVTNDDPLESYFFGRKGDPKKGFQWTSISSSRAPACSPLFYRLWRGCRPTRRSASCWPTTMTAASSLKSSRRSCKRPGSRCSIRAGSICRRATTRRRLQRSRRAAPRSAGRSCRGRTSPYSGTNARSKATG